MKLSFFPSRESLNPCFLLKNLKNLMIEFMFLYDLHLYLLMYSELW